MGVFDLFSANTGPINKGYKALGAAVPQAGAQLTGGVNTAIGTLTDAQKSAIQALMSGQTQAAGAIQGGIDPWSIISQESGGFLPLYAGATGAGGDPNAANAAFQQFWNSTGSQSDLTRGLEGLSRVGASTGQLGQTNMDAIKYSQDLNQNTYQQWLNDLMQGVGVNTQAAGGIQTGQDALANLFSGTGQNIANEYDLTGGAISGLQSGLGSDLANLTLGAGGLPLQKAQAIQGATQTADANTLSALFGLLGGGVNLASAFNKPAPVTNIYGA